MSGPAASAAMVHVQPGRFSDEQRKLILDTCCGGASQSEAEVLIGIAEARGLNPLAQECYFVKRWDAQKGRDVWAVQASIDAFRIKAEETGDYAGQDEPEYEYNERKEVVLARVRIYRKSVPGRAFAVGVARWDEYVQTKKDGSPTRFWAQMPHGQLAKCAEAIGLRKAFPKVLARVYEAAEMAPADNPQIAAEPERAALPAKKEDPGAIGILADAIEHATKKSEMNGIAAQIAKAAASGELAPQSVMVLREAYAHRIETLRAAQAERPSEPRPPPREPGDDAEEDGAP